MRKDSTGTLFRGEKQEENVHAVIKQKGEPATAVKEKT